MDQHRQEKTECVYEDVSLATTDFFARIVTTRPPFSVVFTLWLSTMPALGYP